MTVRPLAKQLLETKLPPAHIYIRPMHPESTSINLQNQPHTARNQQPCLQDQTPKVSSRILSQGQLPQRSTMDTIYNTRIQ